jgi:rSAM/selenodomain-associated transferase 2
MKISIIIPVLNEASVIIQALSSLQPLRQKGHEVIVVDGGSDDDTMFLSKPFADKVIQSPRGRSRQMNIGTTLASGDILLFLHADTFLPEGADQIINEEIKRKKKVWGHFDVKLSGRHWLLRIIELLMNCRSRLSHIATGDQAIFVKREIFETIGGFPEIDLMEDITLTKILKRYGRPICLWQRVLTSSRRWETKGLFRTIFLMWFLRLAYFYKVDTKRLIKLYDPIG